jgi:hypothetical protein
MHLEHLPDKMHIPDHQCDMLCIAASRDRYEASRGELSKWGCPLVKLGVCLALPCPYAFTLASDRLVASGGDCAKLPRLSVLRRGKCWVPS